MTIAIIMILGGVVAFLVKTFIVATREFINDLRRVKSKNAQ
jgi:hypothetical protein